jgi:hypothetical protein
MVALCRGASPWAPPRHEEGAGTGAPTETRPYDDHAICITTEYNYTARGPPGFPPGLRTARATSADLAV